MGLDLLKQLSFSWRTHVGLLLGWVVLGTVLRFVNLTMKPLWTDEFATLVFSLGHSFLTIPVNQVLDAPALLAPAQFPLAAVHDTVQHLLTESNHPPLFFILMHGWLACFPGDHLLWSVRSLPAILGVVGIPASFGLGWVAFRSAWVAQATAACMAVSPFAVYLAQEARHYTLPMVWILASLACCVAVLMRLRDAKPIPIGLVLAWIGVNGLGIATHYFFALTLVAEAIALVGCLVGMRPLKLTAASMRRLSIAVLGTIATGCVWLPFLNHAQDSELTRWIYVGDRLGWDWLAPIGTTLLSWVTMLYLLPIQGVPEGVAIASGITLLLLFGATVAWLGRCLYAARWVGRTGFVALLGVCLGAIALMWGITYGLGMDLTSAFRYHFIYFPALVGLLGAGLVASWQQRWGKGITVGILLLSLVGSLTVVNNWAYQKTHRPDLVVQDIAEQMQERQFPQLVAIAHRTHGQTGRLMAIAWELERYDAELTQNREIRYLLAHETDDPRSILVAVEDGLDAIAQPLDLWLMNIQSVPEGVLNRWLEDVHCQALDDDDSEDGYRYQPFHCAGVSSSDSLP
jgi:uncharacterized membrane protein